MDTIWDIVKAQPITNRLYEMSKVVEEAAALENKAVKTSGQIPPVPIREHTPAEEPAYAVTLSQEAKEVSSSTDITSRVVSGTTNKTQSSE